MKNFQLAIIFGILLYAKQVRSESPKNSAIPSSATPSYFQEAKAECVYEMELDEKILEKALMYEEVPTNEEKCLMMCILKKTNLMDDSNKISMNTVNRIADGVLEYNFVAASAVRAIPKYCNQLIKSVEPCEAAYQITRCVVRKSTSVGLKLFELGLKSTYFN